MGAALVYGWGGWLAATNRLDVGTVVALGAYLTRLYGPLTALSNVNVSIMTALVSFERVFEVLDLPPMIDDAPDAVDLPARANTIEFEHVDFRYPAASEVSLASLESVAVLDTSPNTQVLYDVSFKAEPGQLVALVGPSGAGKSTISSLVSRLYDVTGGVVRDRWRRRPAGDVEFLARHGRCRDPGQSHVPRHGPREPRLRQA